MKKILDLLKIFGWFLLTAYIIIAGFFSCHFDHAASNRGENTDLTFTPEIKGIAKYSLSSDLKAYLKSTKNGCDIY